MPNRRAIDEGTDDTEGHMPRIRIGVTDGVEGETDDTQGQGKHNPGVASDDGDDTEGNSAHYGRSVPPAANPGKR